MSRTCLILVFVAVGRKQRDVAPHLLIRRIHVAGYLGARRVFKLLITVDVDQRALLLALVAVEDAQRNTDAESKRIIALWVVVGFVVGIPRAECGIGRAIGNSQFMVRVRLLDGLERRP